MTLERETKTVATRSDAGYRDDIFMLWYKKGRPAAKTFFIACPASANGYKPTITTLTRWISTDFRERAKTLNLAVQKELELHLVHEKVEMLERHADLGVVMQEMGANWLKDHAEEELTASVAVRLLVEGWRIERESRGISGAIEKVVTMSDDELLDEIQDLINSSPVVIESD